MAIVTSGNGDGDQIESPVNHCIQCTCCVDPCVCVSWHSATLPMLNQHDNWDSSCQETRKRCHINKQWCVKREDDDDAGVTMVQSQRVVAERSERTCFLFFSFVLLTVMDQVQPSMPPSLSLCTCSRSFDQSCLSSPIDCFITVGVHYTRVTAPPFHRCWWSDGERRTKTSLSRVYVHSQHWCSTRSVRIL